MAADGNANCTHEERDDNNGFCACVPGPQRTDMKASSQLKQRKCERVGDIQIWRWKSHNGLASDRRHNKETKPGHNVSVSTNIFLVPCSAMSPLMIVRRNAELRTGQHRKHSANAKNEAVGILKLGTKSLIYRWEKLYKRSTDFVHSLTACHWRGRHIRTERHRYAELQSRQSALPNAPHKFNLHAGLQPLPSVQLTRARIGEASNTCPMHLTSTFTPTLAYSKVPGLQLEINIASNLAWPLTNPLP